MKKRKDEGKPHSIYFSLSDFKNGGEDHGKKPGKLDTIKKGIVFSFLCYLILSAAGCQSLQLESYWRENENNVDGRSDDWVGRMTFMDNPNISLGLQNDENFLYIIIWTAVLLASDRCYERKYRPGKN